MDGQFVIIGAGLAGAKAAETLRKKGFDGAIALIGDERHHPYERPPLSKGYLGGDDHSDSVLPADSWYSEHRIDLHLGARATNIDRADRVVVMDEGSALHYDKLLLARGARSRHLPGAPDGVHYLRTVDDADRLRGALGDGNHLVIVGGGWIGLEVAATARQAGTAVTLVEPQELPMRGSLGPALGQIFADLHRGHGADLRLGTGVDSVEAAAVVLDGGERIDGDAVLVAIGAVPNVELAAAAGLAVDGGVLVDAGLRTSDPAVFAVGDIAAHDHPRFGRIRIEHWANALNQPTVAAANMLGHDETYTRVPYFFSDQYDFGMECRGLPRGDADVIVRGDTGAGEFLAFWVDGDSVLAGMNVGIWDQGDAIAALLEPGRTVDRAKLADPDVPLADV